MRHVPTSPTIGGPLRPWARLARRRQRTGMATAVRAAVLRPGTRAFLDRPGQGLSERGADPSAFLFNPCGRMSALYGAVGAVHDRELTRVLFEPGADRRRRVAVHAAEAESSECLRLFLDDGAGPGGTNPLARARRGALRACPPVAQAGADPTGVRRWRIPSGAAAVPRSSRCQRRPISASSHAARR